MLIVGAVDLQTLCFWGLDIGSHPVGRMTRQTGEVVFVGGAVAASVAMGTLLRVLHPTYNQVQAF